MRPVVSILVMGRRIVAMVCLVSEGCEGGVLGEGGGERVEVCRWTAIVGGVLG